MAEDLIVPMMDFRWSASIATSLTLGYRRRLFQHSCCSHAKRLERQVRSCRRASILVELGKRQKMIGGQEDMIEDLALTLARERGLLKANAA